MIKARSNLAVAPLLLGMIIVLPGCTGTIGDASTGDGVRGGDTGSPGPGEGAP